MVETKADVVVVEIHSLDGKLSISSWVSELFATEDRACARYLRGHFCRCEPKERAHFIFVSKTVREIRVFSINDLNTAETR